MQDIRFRSVPRCTRDLHRSDRESGTAHQLGLESRICIRSIYYLVVRLDVSSCCIVLQRESHLPRYWPYHREVAHLPSPWQSPRPLLRAIAQTVTMRRAISNLWRTLSLCHP